MKMGTVKIHLPNFGKSSLDILKIICYITLKMSSKITYKNETE